MAKNQSEFIVSFLSENSSESDFTVYVFAENDEVAEKKAFDKLSEENKQKFAHTSTLINYA